MASTTGHVREQFPIPAAAIEIAKGLFSRPRVRAETAPDRIGNSSLFLVQKAARPPTRLPERAAARRRTFLSGHRDRQSVRPTRRRRRDDRGFRNSAETIGIDERTVTAAAISEV